MEISNQYCRSYDSVSWKDEFSAAPGILFTKVQTSLELNWKNQNTCSNRSIHSVCPFHPRRIIEYERLLYPTQLSIAYPFKDSVREK
jgi:hypothetical protein